ncbi:MAG TPA: phospholipid carrier-dependent glycosyltransferase, partial [Geobacteraceae bacterium]
LCSYLLGIVAPPFILEGVAEKKSVEKLGEVMRARAGKDTVLASFGPQQGLPFFIHRRIVTVGGLGELEFGSQQGDQSAWFLDIERFKRLWDSPTHLLVFLSEGDLTSLREGIRTQPVIVARQGKKLVISNR